jgi:hypothetical protein
MGWKQNPRAEAVGVRDRSRIKAVSELAIPVYPRCHRAWPRHAHWRPPPSADAEVHVVFPEQPYGTLATVYGGGKGDGRKPILTEVSAIERAVVRQRIGPAPLGGAIRLLTIQVRETLLCGVSGGGRISRCEWLTNGCRSVSAPVPAGRFTPCLACDQSVRCRDNLRNMPDADAPAVTLAGSGQSSRTKDDNRGR